jgi:hypothetical protein
MVFAFPKPPTKISSLKQVECSPETCKVIHVLVCHRAQVEALQGKTLEREQVLHNQCLLDVV